MFCNTFEGWRAEGGPRTDVGSGVTVCAPPSNCAANPYIFNCFREFQWRSGATAREPSNVLGKAKNMQNDLAVPLRHCATAPPAKWTAKTNGFLKIPGISVLGALCFSSFVLQSSEGWRAEGDPRTAVGSEVTFCAPPFRWTTETNMF